MNSFVHGHITFALAIRFILMCKIMIARAAHCYAHTPATLLYEQTFFFAWAISRFHAQNFAQARQHVGHTPKSFMAGHTPGSSRDH